ncbi:MAG: hypothetical protein P8L20_00465 [Flavobacteriales bacterium]|nr:hypothetical protein [Flavobacteriales bacterium]|tara:strand:+ start:3154 stop:3405 length:252 start_codon:yes stop_codon:yes gene_type:complete
MRTVAKIEHPKMDISIYLRENKYIVKIVMDQYEQVYRINGTDVTGMDDMKAMVSGEFLSAVYMRFVEMSKDLKSAFLNINKVS